MSNGAKAQTADLYFGELSPWTNPRRTIYLGVMIVAVTPETMDGINVGLHTGLLFALSFLANSRKLDASLDNASTTK